MNDQRDVVININNSNVEVESDTSTATNSIRNSIKNVFSKIFNSPLFEKFIYFLGFLIGGSATDVLLLPLIRNLKSS